MSETPTDFNPPSEITKVKSEFAKHFLEEQFKGIHLSTTKTRARRKTFEEKLNQTTFDSIEKAVLETNFRKCETANLRVKRRVVRVDQFIKIRVIGQGAFGEVWLVREPKSNQIYAMKVLRKKDLIQRNQILNTLAERDFLTQSKNPFSVQLIYSFQDAKKLYLVMEYMAGGDMMNLLINRSFLTETETRFFIAETLLAIHHVHLTGYIHRDIKPDNLLLSRDGHIRLTDFGLSAKIERYSDPLVRLIDELMEVINVKNVKLPNIQFEKRSRAQICSTVGTPDYIAPEVLMKKPYEFSVDFWSLGAIMYEMLFGSPPFLADSPRHTALKIVRWRETLVFPPQFNVSAEAIDLIKKLLCDKEDRLDFEQIKNHSFFNGIDFENVLFSQSPLIPNVASEDDSSNFDEFESKFDQEGPDADPDDLASQAIANVAFLGFRYIKGDVDFDTEEL